MNQEEIIEWGRFIPGEDWNYQLACFQIELLYQQKVQKAELEYCIFKLKALRYKYENEQLLKELNRD
jgi:hypothetical protein